MEYETLPPGTKAMVAAAGLRNYLWAPRAGGVLDVNALDLLDATRAELSTAIPFGDLAQAFVVDDVMRGVKHAAMIGMGVRTGLLSGWHYSAYAGRHV